MQSQAFHLMVGAKNESLNTPCTVHVTSTQSEQGAREGIAGLSEYVESYGYEVDAEEHERTPESIVYEVTVTEE